MNCNTVSLQQGIITISELIDVGERMSNLCFNLSQKASISPDDRNTMHRLCKEWDEKRAKLREATL